MNNDRRDQIKALGPRVSALTAAIAAIRGEVEGIRDEEAEYLESMPESLKGGDRGQVAEAAISALDDALNLIDTLDTADIVASLGEAADREVPAETVESKVDAKERDRRRRELLPAWAKADAARLAGEVERLKAKLSASLPEPTGEPGEFLVGGYSGPMVGRKLPFERIDVPSFDVEIYHDEGRNALTLRSRKGQIVVRPLVSNEVLVRGEPFFS